MGRPRLSDKTHALHDTKPHASTAKTESKLAASQPTMPRFLSKEAKREWNRLLPLLLERGSLTEADSAALALYAENHSRWLAAKREVEEHGILMQTTVLDSNGSAVTVRKTNPALRTLENCERSLRNFLREFGLTPATRERVLPARKPAEKRISLLDMLKKEAGVS